LSSEFSASCSATPVSCLDSSPTRRSSDLSGGTAPYSYLWSTAAVTSSIGSLAAGTYTVTVTDNNGCTATCESVVTQPSSAVSASYRETPVICSGGANGTSSVTAGGGTAPY